MQTRIKILASSFIFAFLLIVIRLFYWQIIKGEELSIRARDQQRWGRFVQASRGDILASDNTWLAARGESWLLYAQLNEISDEINKIADVVAPLLIESEPAGSVSKNRVLDEANRLKLLLSRKDVVWVPLKHKLTSEVKANIEALDINGLGFEFEETRVYPEASSAAHLLGFVGKNSEGEDQGYFGLEGYYDLVLSGKPGYITRDSDARGIPILTGDSKEISAVRGIGLVTYVDKAVQILLDRKLKEGIEKYKAIAGTAIVIDPKTGGILGISSYPSFDPAKYYEYGDEFFINPAVSLSFEPGSIFKVLIMAAALDSDKVKADTKCDICFGPVKVDKYTIETWNKEYRKDSNVTDIIVHSDNVGMVFVGKKLGTELMYEYLDKFGMGKLTGIDLQGEMTPKLREKEKWNEVDLATASFGQGVAVTPIQMIMAVNAIANKGVLLKPKVVKSIIAPGWEEIIDDDQGRQVISEKTATEVAAMMVEAAKNGEAKWTYARGFGVAGKTGTAQIPISGHYDEEKTIGSFIGFAPANDPKFLMLVTLREPKTSPWASETAAPLWYLIAKDLFLYFGIQPEN